MKMHHAALAIIFNSDGQILMSKRHEPRHKSSHNKWQFPGGGIEEGESAIEAVIREVKEEANIEVQLLSTVPILQQETISHSRKEYITLLGFPALYISGTISCEGDPESSEIKWFDCDKIDYSNALSGTKELAEQSLLIWKKL